MRLTDGNPQGDSYAVSISAPSRYDHTATVEVVYARNVHGKSAQEAADKVPASLQHRILAVWPERF